MTYKTSMNEIPPHRQELRQRITATALQAFKEKGIKAVRMDDLAEMLNISKRTLYEVFETKKDLIYACITHNFTMEQAAHEALIRHRKDNVLECCFMVMENILESFSRTSPEFFRDLQKYPRFLELRNEQFQKDTNEMVAFLEKGKEQGLFRDDIRFELILDLLSPRVDSTFSRHMGRTYTIKEIFYYVVVTLLRGCATGRGRDVIDDFLAAHPEMVPDSGTCHNEVSQAVSD